MKPIVTALFLLAPILTLAAPIPLKSPAGKGSVTFIAVGTPVALKVHGTAPAPQAKVTLKEGQLLGSFSFQLDQLDTQIGLRNEHLRTTLETTQYPKAELTLVYAPLDATLSSGGEKEFRGKLALHGQEKEVSGKFSAQEGEIQAKFQLKLSDFGIVPPKHLGVTVKDEVDVAVELPLQKE